MNNRPDIFESFDKSTYHEESTKIDPTIQPYRKPTLCAPYERRILWGQVILITAVHIAGFYGLYLAFVDAKWQTSLYTFISGVFIGVGLSAGVHRYYSHRSFEAKRPLQLLLLSLHTLCTQNNIIWWARIHRLHHKFADTDADRHNIRRGFFFAHMGWLMASTHPEAQRAIKTIDISDLEADPVLRFQRKYNHVIFAVLTTMVCSVPILLWDETLANAFFLCGPYRVMLILHSAGFINSAAHTFGPRMYDGKIKASKIGRFLTWYTLGEGSHNYHHTFPWDYKTSELGLGHYSLTNTFLDMCLKFGWIYNVKTVSQEMAINRAIRTGDGSHPMVKANFEPWQNLPEVTKLGTKLI